MHPKWDMRTARPFAIALLLTAVVVGAAFSQPSRSKADSHEISEGHATGHSHPLTDDDRLSLIAAALDARVRRDEPDCSHLVHAIYEQAGFDYAYAPSSDLYAGTEDFQRVKKPEPGDLVVWRGHVGIVIKPSQHVFFSFLSDGPGIDDYTSSYWKHRGKPRFYRYIKASTSLHRSPQLLRTNRVHRPISDSEDDR
jgi:NlpC/P60 family protein